MVSERETISCREEFFFLHAKKGGTKKKEVKFVCEGDKIAANLEQECSMGSRAENRGDAERTELSREAW